MRNIIYRSLFCGSLFMGVVVGCGKKNKSNGASSTSGKTYSTSASSPLHLTSSFDANTPTGFKKAATSFQLAAASDACVTQFGSGTAQSIACQTMSDIKDRFFGSGPTVIHDRLTDLDGRLNGTLARFSSIYTPCLDSTRTTGGDFKITAEGGSKYTRFPPFSLTAVPLKTTFKDNSIFDTGKSLYLSCAEKFGTGNSQSRLGYGFKDGMWSLYQEQASGLGLYGTADKDDTIDLWFSIGDPVRDAAQNTLETSSATGLYPMSTGLAHIISNPKLGLMGISIVGAGLGPGCGSQLLMNGSTLYFQGNVNNYGACTATDYGATSGNGATFDSTKSNVTVCMNVTGTSLTPSVDGLETCVKSGLLSRDGNEAIVSPFAAAGLKHLTADLASTETGILKARAWMGSFFMQGTDLSAVQPLGGVELEPNDKIEVKGYSVGGWEMERKTLADKAISSVSVACNAADASKTTPLAETYELSVAQIISTLPKDDHAKPDAAAVSDDGRKTQVLASLNKALIESGDTAPMLEIGISGTKGTTYTGIFKGTAKVTVDGSVVGSSDLTLPSSSGGQQNSVKVALASVPNLTADSKFKLDLSGTLTLKCDNPIATIRSVGVKPGLAHLALFLKN